MRTRQSPDSRPLHVSSTEALITAAVLATLAAPVAAQRQFDELRMRGLPADSDGTVSVVLGDVDGDSDLDVVLGNYQGQIRLYLHDDPGQYTDATGARMPAVVESNEALALGDVDGDGDLDLVVGNIGQNRLYLNDGTGSFADATAGRLPIDSDGSLGMALGDVDGDGDLDMVCGNWGVTASQNRLYLNDGTGTYTDATAARMPIDNSATQAVALGDVDGDGDLDMIFGNYRGRNTLYLNDGSGAYTDATAQLLPVDTDVTFSVSLGDVDGDGDLDIVFGSYSPSTKTRLLLNDGTGAFTDVTATRLPGDPYTAIALALGDVDGDGDLDMILGSPAQNRLYLNDGMGIFADATAQLLPTDLDFTFALAAGDIEGDGDLDLVFGNRGISSLGQNRLYLNDGNGNFLDAAASRLPTVFNSTHAVAPGDVDGDGDLDMVFGNYYFDRNRLYLNDGSGTYTDATSLLLPDDNDSTRALALGDVDGDDDLDMVIGNEGLAGQDRLYLNDGTGTYTDVTASKMPTGSQNHRAVALGDVDGDGDLDMVLGSYFPSDRNRLYLNDGSGTYTDATAARLPADSDTTNALALGDVDGDGDLDMVFGNGGQNRLYLNGGMGTFTDATAQRLPVDVDVTRAVVVGDVDGDGDLDMVLGNDFSRQNRLYLNDGAGTYTDATARLLPVDSSTTSAVALGDVDGDGDLDMVVGNGGSGPSQDQLYLNDGTGTFTDASPQRLPADADITNVVAVGDVDGDDDVDVIFGRYGQSRLYVNLLRQLDTPCLVIPGREYKLNAYARYGPPRSGDIALAYISTARANVPLPPLGTLGIDLSRAAGFPPFSIPQPTGMGSISFTVPNQPRLIGIPIYAQALLVPSGGQSFLTNVTADVIIR